MKATITARNGQVREFKGRFLDVRLTHGIIEIIDAHDHSTMFAMQQQDLGELTIEGKPKPRKKPKQKPAKEERVEISIDTGNVQAILDQFQAQINETILCNDLAEKIAEMNKRLSALGAPPAPPAPQEEPVEVTATNESVSLNYNDGAMTINEPVESAQVPVATDDADSRHVKASERRDPTSSSSPCRDCGRFNRHSVKCGFMTGDQEQQPSPGAKE